MLSEQRRVVQVAEREARNIDRMGGIWESSHTLVEVSKPSKEGWLWIERNFAMPGRGNPSQYPGILERTKGERGWDRLPSSRKSFLHSGMPGYWDGATRPLKRSRQNSSFELRIGVGISSRGQPPFSPDRSSSARSLGSHFAAGFRESRADARVRARGQSWQIEIPWSSTVTYAGTASGSGPSRSCRAWLSDAGSRSSRSPSL